MSVIIDYSDLKRRYADNDQFKALVESLMPYLFQNDAWDPMKEKEWNVDIPLTGGRRLTEVLSSLCTADKGISTLRLIQFHDVLSTTPPAFPFAAATTTTNQNSSTTATTTMTTKSIAAHTTKDKIPFDISGNSKYHQEMSFNLRQFIILSYRDDGEEEKVLRPIRYCKII